MKATKNDRGIQIRRRIKAFIGRWVGLRQSWWRYVRNANCDYYKSQTDFLYILISNYHVIEKSLAMPDFEPGHALERVKVVVGDLIKYRELGFDLHHPQYVAAMQAIREYACVHHNLGFSLPKDLLEEIDFLFKDVEIPEHVQPTVSKEQFFANVQSSFPEFARSRHSVRSYSDKEISEDTLKAVVNLARTTPTGCNRQPNRTYVVCDNSMIRKIVNLQGGGRGFAEKANKLLVVTSAIDAFSYNEYNEVWKAGGMYTMNLLYALHSYQIGACPLMWNGMRSQDKALREILNIPSKEEVVMIIAAGYPLDKFRYVTSVRNNVEDSLIIVR